MDKESVIARLREHELQLRAAGIVHLRLHGSMARRTASPASDVDLIAELDATKHLSLLDIIGLENQLSDLLGIPVDLSPQHMLKSQISDSAAQEAVLAF